MSVIHQKPSAYIVYVHLGVNPSPTLIEFCKQSVANLEGSYPILISDHPDRWTKFPGLVIEYEQEKSKSEGMFEFKKRNPEKRSIANGYWLYTFERLFSLKSIEHYIYKDVPIIHLESDVVSYVDHNLLNLMLREVASVSVPRFNEETGVGSLVYFPNYEAVDNFEKQMTSIISRNPNIDNDMNLLGYMLNSNILRELPSGRGSNSEMELSYGNLRVLIDGAGVGQYLFGQDPLHTGNRRISGYQNPFHPITFSDAKWEIILLNNREYLTFISESDQYLIAAIHVHSKAIIPPILSKSNFWIQCLAEANQETERIGSEYIPDMIHSIRISYTNRLRIARKNGLRDTFKKKILRLIKNKEITS